jgi:hypothetical protein
VLFEQQPLGQVTLSHPWQAPLMQFCPFPHGLPQAPQLSKLLLKLVHRYWPPKPRKQHASPVTQGLQVPPGVQAAPVASPAWHVPFVQQPGQVPTFV